MYYTKQLCGITLIPVVDSMSHPSREDQIQLGDKVRSSATENWQLIKKGFTHKHGY